MNRPDPKRSASRRARDLARKAARLRKAASLAALALCLAACAGPTDPCTPAGQLTDNATGRTLATVEVCTAPAPCPPGHACIYLSIPPR